MYDFVNVALVSVTAFMGLKLAKHSFMGILGGALIVACVCGFCYYFGKFC